MQYLPIPTILYAIWRMYKNYKEKIKSYSEISLIVGALIALIMNYMFPGNIFTTFAHIVLIAIISSYIIGRNEDKINRK